MTLIVPIKTLPHFDGLELPHFKTEQSAGMDLSAALPEGEEMVLQPMQRALVPTGISMALPAGYEAQIRPRSGLSFKHGVTMVNAPGTIDADYRGEVGVLLINLGHEPFTITRGMRIAQMVIAKHETVSWQAVNDLEDTDRGAGGFGSTGTHG